MSFMQGLSNEGAGAMRAFVEAHGPMVRAIARRFLHDPCEIEDAVQEVFVELWRCADRFDPKIGSEAAFVCTVARRRLIDRRRAARRRSAHEEVAEAPGGEVFITLDTRRSEVAADASRALRRVEENLRPEQREVLFAVCEGLSHEEIAERTGLPLGSVKSHVRRGLGRLRRELVTQPGSQRLAAWSIEGA